MFMRKSTTITGIVILVLLLFVGVVWYACIVEDRRHLLTVSFLNVGQGDAIFIDTPSGRQVLVDGGPDASVLRALSTVMPWYDHSIDVLVATHPDADHVSGLIDVLGRYQTGIFVTSSVEGNTGLWKTLQETVSKQNIQQIVAQRGYVFDIGGGAYMEVLSPDRSVRHTDTNVGCLVMRLVYGDTSFMLPCDAPQSVEDYLVRLDGHNLQSTVLKAGHHGSKTSASLLFVGFVEPKYAVYSRGCDNKYGFPDQETVDVFKKFGIPTLDTCQEGSITLVSDGKTVERK